MTKVFKVTSSVLSAKQKTTLKDVESTVTKNKIICYQGSTPKRKEFALRSKFFQSERMEILCY